MCGIFGLVATGSLWEDGLRVTPQQAANALRLMQSRGPDYSRLTFCAEYSTMTALRDSDLSYIPRAQAILGHNRLSIIDLSPNARQPMPRGDYWLTYNGEIYNYKNLRAVLEEHGESFESQSDTEVLLALAHHFGSDRISEMLRQINGMFAFALWDNEQKRLLLARDPYGIKPLYYTRLTDGTFAFASEIKALAALPGFDKSLDYTALSEHLTFQNTFGSKTLLKSVHMLEPGHWAMLDAQTGEFNIQKYWEPVFTPDYSIKPAEAIDTVRQLVEEAIKNQLVGDVPIGTFLSGGMDTGVITAITTQGLPNLHTFTAGFDVSQVSADEQLFDEREASRQLARQMGTQHHELLIDQTAMADILPSVVWHLDDFRAGISYQSYLVSHMVRQSVTVVLSGVGGDELFAGYPWRYEPLMQMSPADFPAHYYQSWVRLLSEEEKKTLFTPDAWNALNGFSSQDSFNQVLSGCKAEHPLDQALCFDMKTFLHGLLVVDDRLSMAHSVESRVPFLDNRLVDYCLNLPNTLKLNPDSNGQPTAKWVLKEALRGLLPDEVLFRRKQGFTPPDASWYRGETRQYIERLLLSQQFEERGLFQPQALRNILDAHFNGQRNHRFLIWSLMCLEWWHRLLLDPAAPTAPKIPSAFAGVRVIQ